MATRSPADLDALRLFVRVNDIRGDRIARRLRVHPSTVSRWLSGATIRVPIARMIAAVAAEREGRP